MMNIKKQCALLLLLVPSFISSITIEEILKDTAFRENNPELVVQYEQADKEHHETSEYKKYAKEDSLYVSLLRGEHNLMSRPEAFGHWVNGNISFGNFVRAELDLNSFSKNCYESFLKLDQKNRASSWRDCETKECELYREKSKLNEGWQEAARRNLEIAQIGARNTDEGKKVTLIRSKIEEAYEKFRVSGK